jgi:ornithine decarboxylase
MTVFPVHATSSQGRTPSKISNSGNSERLVDLEIETKLSTLGQTIQDEESFFVADLGQVIRQHSRWERNLPGVYPFYGAFDVRDEEKETCPASVPILF